MTITPKKGEGKDVTIAGQTNEQTGKDSATQPSDHGRLRRAIEQIFPPPVLFICTKRP